jgi:hypothetical protein
VDGERMKNNSDVIKAYKLSKILFVIYSVIFIYELIFSSYETKLSTGIGWLLMFIGIIIFKLKVKNMDA